MHCALFAWQGQIRCLGVYYTFLEPILELYIFWTNFRIYISWTNFGHIHDCSHFMNDGIWEDTKTNDWIIFISKVAHAFKSWILIWVGVGVPLYMKRRGHECSHICLYNWFQKVIVWTLKQWDSSICIITNSFCTNSTQLHGNWKKNPHPQRENCIFRTPNIALRSFVIPNIGFIKTGLQTLGTWLYCHLGYFSSFLFSFHVFGRVNYSFCPSSLLHRFRSRAFTGTVGRRRHRRGKHCRRPLPSRQQAGCLTRRCLWQAGRHPVAAGVGAAAPASRQAGCCCRGRAAGH